MKTNQPNQEKLARGAMNVRPAMVACLMLASIMGTPGASAEWVEGIDDLESPYIEAECTDRTDDAEITGCVLPSGLPLDCRGATAMECVEGVEPPECEEQDCFAVVCVVEGEDVWTCIDQENPFECENDCELLDPCENPDDCEVCLADPCEGEPCELNCEEPDPCAGDECEEPCHTPNLVETLECFVDEQLSVVPGQPEVWPIIDFGGAGCTGQVSETEFSGSVGEVEVDTALVDVTLKFMTVEVRKVYYQVTCEIEARPMAMGQYGFLRTVWLEQNSVKTHACSYTGTPGNDRCADPARGETGFAGTTPRTGSFEDGKSPTGVLGCWVGPEISASGVGFQGADEITASLDHGGDCGTFGIRWVSADDGLEGVVDFLNDVI